MNAAATDISRLNGLGLGWIDMRLLASARLSRLPFWTVDKRLAALASTIERA